MGWADESYGKGIFWLSGLAGTGKSTIARTVAEAFDTQGRLGASFFFKKGEGDRGNAGRFFTTVVHQLVQRIPILQPEVQRALVDEPTITEKSLKNQFEKLILRPLERLNQVALPSRRLIVVIDALDKCDQEKDIRSILTLLAQAKEIGPISLRIFLTSRPELPVRSGFRDMAEGVYQDFILHEVPRPLVGHDIALYFQHEFCRIREERSLPATWPGDNCIQDLVDMAIPLFIFAATVCRFVGDNKANPRTRLEAFLEYRSSHAISKMDKTYLPIVDQLFLDQDEVEKDRLASEFRHIVGTIVTLATPLSIVSLATLLDIAKEDIICTLDPFHSVLSISTDNNIPVRILHLSFYEFLVDPLKSGLQRIWVTKTKRIFTLQRGVSSYCLALAS